MNRQLEQLVWSRAEKICEYCHLPQELVGMPFQVDHIIAAQHGGKTIEENLALSCLHCNKHKGPNIASIDPISGKIVPLFHPRRQNLKRHFHLDGPVLAGATQIGRATIRALAINAAILINVRLELIDEGIFPDV